MADERKFEVNQNVQLIADLIEPNAPAKGARGVIRNVLTDDPRFQYIVAFDGEPVVMAVREDEIAAIEAEPQPDTRERSRFWTPVAAPQPTPAAANAVDADDELATLRARVEALTAERDAAFDVVMKFAATSTSVDEDNTCNGCGKHLPEPGDTVRTVPAYRRYEDHETWCVYGDAARLLDAAAQARGGEVR